MDLVTMFVFFIGLIVGAGIVGTNFRFLKLDFFGGLPLVIKFTLIDKLMSYPEVISLINSYFYGFVFGAILLGIAKLFGVDF